MASKRLAVGTFGLIIALVFALAGVGKPYYLNQAHATCYDGVDNDNYDPLVPKADFQDLDCLYMPYDFGLGESANQDNFLGTTAFVHPDPSYQNYGQYWNSTGSTYPTLYEFLKVHYYDGVPCENINTNPNVIPPGDILSFWKNQYSISDKQTGYDDWFETCN